MFETTWDPSVSLDGAKEKGSVEATGPSRRLSWSYTDP